MGISAIAPQNPANRRDDKSGAPLIAALFTTLFLIWGPINASSVFFLPVVKHFGWSRAFFSLLVSTAPLAAGVSSPAIGWHAQPTPCHKTAERETACESGHMLVASFSSAEAFKSESWRQGSDHSGRHRRESHRR